MKKLRLQLVLMITAILGVAGFQSFWLKQTYAREENALGIKTDIAFRDAVEELQVAKFKLDNIPGDTSKAPTKLKLVFTDSVDEKVNVKLNGSRIISTINVIRRKAGDTLIKDSLMKGGIFVSKDQTYFDRKLDIRPDPPGTGKPGRDHVLQLLYGVDSIQDSLKIAEIDTALTKQLAKQQTAVPFTVSKITRKRGGGPDMNINEVTVGFANPVTYKLKLGNTFPYLLKQIAWPILFSLLLLGITVLSFVMLYRSLMQQRRLTAIKNEFIGNITHELKTPIATVSVAIEAMKNFNALQNPERTQEYLGIAGQELNRLSLLVDKVLRLSMFENREVELKYTPFNFAELVQEVTKSMQLQFEKAAAKVTTELKGIDFTIDADRMHITSVVYNLLDNAIKYSKENPEIKITATATNDAISLSIEDNGIGINPEYKDKIFDKFFRVPHGDQHNVKGYGLGLSYAAHIIERHQGTIEAVSDGKNGTVFNIKLPRKHAG